jgi:hypothetical protein
MNKLSVKDFEKLYEEHDGLRIELQSGDYKEIINNKSKNANFANQIKKMINRKSSWNKNNKEPKTLHEKLFENQSQKEFTISDLKSIEPNYKIIKYSEYNDETLEAFLLSKKLKK